MEGQQGRLDASAETDSAKIGFSGLGSNCADRTPALFGPSFLPRRRL